MLEQKYFDLLSCSKDKAEFFIYLVDKFGQAKVLRSGTENEEHLRNTYHDYIYYCFTKSTRSIFAAIELAKKNFSEDSLIILRTVYESYLHIAHTLYNPNKVYEYVFHTVGLSTGKYVFKKRQNGTLNYKRILDSSTQKEFDYGTSTGTMAKYSFNSCDTAVHKDIYHYLSEHTHPNMLASGNYRSWEKLHYSAEPLSMRIETPFWILYIIYILGDALYYYHFNINEWNVEDLTLLEINEFTNLRKSMQEELLNYLEILNIDTLSRNNLVQRIFFDYNFDID
jgi:hypothetical protein